ncbi:MAG: HAD family hydrolase [Cytophagales bacterium]|nr:HAD family hydrolase [Cytophagales bacterium]
MKIISFDLDDTLISSIESFETEKQSIFSQLIDGEKLRKGTKELFTVLKKENYEVWIYTTSYRSKSQIRTTFLGHGIWVNNIINQPISVKRLRKHQCYASKNPKLFGIDIHIDDLKGVELEGEKYGFKTIIIDPLDKNWVDIILERIQCLQNK